MKPFLEEITVWSIFSNYLVYKPVAPDEGHEYFHILDLDKRREGKEAIVRVWDFTRGNDQCN